MKLVVNENSGSEEVEVIINCKQIDEEVIKIISSIKSNNTKISLNKDHKIFIMDVDNILYFESVDKKTFAYTETNVYETHLRLYEIEDRYSDLDFFRASKSTIINIPKIKMMRPIFGGKIEVLLENEEKLIVSRQYVPILKNKLEY